MIGQGRPSSLIAAAARCAAEVLRPVVSCRRALVLSAAIAIGGWLPAHSAGQQPVGAEPAPNEPLRIVANRSPLIFEPGEQFSFELRPVLADAVPGTTLDIRTTLSAARGDETLWSNEQRMEVPVQGEPRISLNIPLPTAEGAYKIGISAVRPSGFHERFFPAAATPMAERSFDIVVLDPRPQSYSEPEEWESVLQIDPTSPRWWERLPSWTQLRRIPGLNRGPLGSIRAGSVELSLGRFIELPRTMPGMDPHWQAYSLPLESIGTPHLLEIEYPADEEQHFSISIVEPNAAGIINGIGRDAGVYVEGMGRGEAKSRQTHRLVFWPRTQVPLLLLANAHRTAAAHFGHIRVLKHGRHRLTTERLQPPAPERLVAAYVARPLAAEAFGASDSLAPTSASTETKAQTAHDWQTFYESATRLADYARYSGYNSAVISVLADGRSKLNSAPVGHAARGTALGERDGLELMLRVFDREGLKFLPALQFAAPLPDLEPLCRGSDPQTSGLEWIGPDGRTWLATHGAENDLAPHYNLLNPRVQQAIIQVVRELVNRCERHPSFAGVSVQLSAQSYAQLPPLEWGLDDATVARFERETGTQLNASGPGRFAKRHALLTGEHAAAWQAWRAACVTAFYEQIAKLVRQNNSQRCLLLTLEDSFAHPQIAARIRPDLVGENHVEDALVHHGIDRHALEKLAGVVVCPARFVGSISPLSDRGLDLELNQAAAIWHRESDPTSTAAALLYHRPERHPLSTFAAKSPIRVAGEMTLVEQPLAYGTAVRQPYVEALLDGDPSVLLDGGELLPLGQEDRLRRVRSILRRLPVAAEASEYARQPVVVRTYAEPSHTTLLIINACPWNTEAEVILELDQAVTLEPLQAPPSEGQQPPAAAPTLAAGKQPWRLSLEPYAIEAVRIASSDVKVVEVRAAVSNSGKAELAARVADLANRDLTAPRLYSGLSNPSFEPLSGAGPVPGWHVSGSEAIAELDAIAPQDGKTCLYVHGRGENAAIDSEPFATPATGQLAMTVFARCQKIDPGTELRMVFETSAGPAYRWAGRVGGTQADAQRLETEWRPFAILVDDLPLDSQSRMRVRFELSGPGEVWIDNVKLYDLLFPLKFYRHAQAEIKQLLILINAVRSAAEAGRIADSVRLLNGYWPRFITAYTPLAQPPIAVQPAPKPEATPALTTPADEDEQAAPSISERIKRFVPFVR
jgi:hypothetical protein